MANWNRMKFRISAPCCILSQPQLIFLNFIARREFYPFLPQKSHRVDLFWFQQDEFYRLHKSCNKPIYAFQFQKDRIIFYIPAGRYKCSGRSFNSQRDGILLIPEARGNLFLKFQFPTGWNSTTTPKIAYSYCGVSIPNGMEFYTKTAWSALCFKSFNSQRDGILQWKKFFF